VDFSSRYGYSEQPSGGLIREDAPEAVRIGFLYRARPRLETNGLRELVCYVLGRRPDPSNWSEPNVHAETENLIFDAPWYRFYDIVEATIAEYRSRDRRRLPPVQSLISGESASTDVDQLVDELNSLFYRENLAWHIVDDRVTLRTGVVSDVIVGAALKSLDEADRVTAASELQKAMRALSQRPEPDTRDAVRFAAGAMEALARDVTGDRRATLGQILKAHRKSGTLLHEPLMEALEKCWGYANDVARHVDETKVPTIEEAILVVGLVASAIAYLGRRRQL